MRNQINLLLSAIGAAGTALVCFYLGYWAATLFAAATALTCLLAAFGHNQRRKWQTLDYLRLGALITCVGTAALLFALGPAEYGYGLRWHLLVAAGALAALGLLFSWFAEPAKRRRRTSPS